MASYYVNDTAQQNGDHEVHKYGCYWLSLAKSTTYLGEFSSCRPAVKKAKERYKTADGCYYCCNECHKS